MKQLCIFVCSLALLLTGCGGRPATADAPAPVTKPQTQTSINSVVFIGDSLTALWDLSNNFPAKDYTNRGVPTERTDQILSRFKRDVIDLHPDAVVIWAGTNDLTANVPIASLEDNLRQMYEQSRSAGILPIAVTITPRREGLAAANPQVVAVDEWIRDYAKANNISIADFYPATVDADGMLRADLAADYVHFTRSAYPTVLDPIASGAIAAAGKTP